MATAKALHFFDREAISTVQLLEDHHEWEVQSTCPQIMLFLISQPKHRLWVLKRTISMSTQNKCLNWWVIFLSSCSIFLFIWTNRTLQIPGPEIIKLFSCSTQLSTTFILLINVKMPTIVGILTFISRINTASERLKARKISVFQHFSFYVSSAELCMKKGPVHSYLWNWAWI